MEKNNKTRQPANEVKKGSAGKRGNKKPFERKNDPVANQGSGSETAQAARSREQEHTQNQPSGEWRRPLTNQDEQRKPTNEGGSSDTGMQEDEQEGDSNLRKIEPYKNIGDDSEEVEKKTPVD